MASGERQTVSFTTDGGTAEEIEAYETRSDSCENRSQAVEELVQIGLREQRGPILYRWRETAAQVALIYACASLATLIIGMGTAMLSVWQTIGVAGAFALVGLGILAAVELGRTLGGYNELAMRLRRVRQ